MLIDSEKVAKFKKEYGKHFSTSKHDPVYQRSLADLNAKRN